MLRRSPSCLWVTITLTQSRFYTCQLPSFGRERQSEGSLRSWGPCPASALPTELAVFQLANRAVATLKRLSALPTASNAQNPVRDAREHTRGYVFKAGGESESGREGVVTGADRIHVSTFRYAMSW